MRSPEDLTATARIRDAAIKLWGEQGFGASVRAIAEAAGVSPGLVIHHYGSKEGLRQAVDGYLLEYIRSEKSRTLTSNDPKVWLDALDEIESFAPMVRYLLHSVQSGGEPGRAFLQRSIHDAEQYLDDGVRAGTIKPSRDPKGRALWVSLTGVGALAIYVQMYPDDDLRTILRRYSDELIFPAIEIYTEGLMTDPTMLDAFAAQQENPLNEGDSK
ncbi:TetR family transcriptional regulator [Mycobacterium sp. NPDC050853]|uniref:TetR/AcrR family transcriptional regulator n=1 Tax=Mycobacterium sp. NPDC050853 TaxID=3155160 RepID=UPI0033DAA3E0